MKQNLKNYLKFGIFFFGISFILHSCLKDDVAPKTVETISNKKCYIKHLYTKEIAKNPEIVSAIKRISTSTSKRVSPSKTLTDSVTGIEIYEDYARYLENPDLNYHSYTFYVTNTPENGGLENVMISLQ